ncbi:hypothetical protein F5Y16DRAFT_155003 [Xylariaceae sp. FL0255]|nr:hypothetical protein F5Y16DRAFT_155003 [Xylariaceae sp. FL0255]
MTFPLLFHPFLQFPLIAYLNFCLFSVPSTGKIHATKSQVKVTPDFHQAYPFFFYVLSSHPIYNNKWAWLIHCPARFSTIRLVGMQLRLYRTGRHHHVCLL